MAQRVLIVGGGYAGLMAAARAARAGAAQVTLVDARAGFEQRIRLHETLAGARPRTLAYAPLLARRGVGFVQATVEALEPRRGRVQARAADGAALALDYDQLVLALGSRTATDTPGAAEHALRLDDQTAVTRAADRVQAAAATRGRVLVVGGGLTGIETATELAERFPALRICLASSAALGAGYSEAAQAHLRARLTALNIELLEHAPVVALERGQALLAGGLALPFDLCVWSAGFRAPDLGRAAGLEVDRLGRICVGATLQVPDFPNILVAGDAAAVAGAPHIRMSCASAMPLGAQAGANLARLLRGEPPEPLAFGFTARCVSLGRGDAMLQFVAPDDTPLARVWTRRSAAVVKELICRMTISVIQQELRSGWALYRWPQPSPEAQPAPAA